MKIAKITILTLLFALAGAATAQDNSARAGFTPDNTPPLPNTTLGATSEGFDDILTLPGDGWLQINNSSSQGTTDWFQGNDTVFPAHMGATTAYIAGNFNATGTTVINLWLVMPDLGFLQSVSFFTRTVTGNTFPDRMEVRHDPSASGDVGTGDMDVGNFTNLLLEINPNLMTGGYPDTWTNFVVNPQNVGQVAFRYFVTDAGPVGNNSNYIGIDTVEWVIGVPVPEIVPTLGAGGLAVLALLLGVGGLVLVRRRQRT